MHEVRGKKFVHELHSLSGNSRELFTVDKAKSDLSGGKAIMRYAPRVSDPQACFFMDGKPNSSTLRREASLFLTDDARNKMQTAGMHRNGG